MTTDEVNVKLTADGSQFEREMTNAGQKSKEFGKTVEDSTGKAADGFGKLKNAIVGLGLINGLKTTLNLAGELEQNLGGAKAVFGSYAKDMQDMAAGAFSKLGLSQSDYLATANKMGALFKGSGFSAAQSADMTTKAMQRAADVASIMGVDGSAAMESIAGAAKGNFTMMDNLGVAINDTTLKLYAQEHGLGKLETTQQKVNAAMQMFLDKTEYAAGNYERENDTFAGAFQTAKAEVENLVAAVGTELLPAATTIIPIVTDVIREVAPVVGDVASGISWVAQGLKQLDSPMVKTITYVGLATVAIRKMKLALGGTASGLILLGTLLSWVIGRLSETEEEEAAVVETSMDGAAVAADSAAESVDGLTGNIENAEKAANRLAGFDEITKLNGGGGGSIASKIATAEDLDRLKTAGEEVAGLQSNLDSLEVPEVKMPDINFGQIVDEAAKFGGNVLSAIFGTEEEKYQALNELNVIVEKLFGKEWSDKWKNIGSDIYTALNGSGKQSTDALLRLRDGVYNLFGKGWTDFWMGVGGAIEQAFNAIKPPGADSSINYDVTQIPFLVEGLVLDNLREGMTAEEALKNAEYNVVLGNIEYEAWWENYDDKITLDDVETWRNNLINAGEIVVDESSLQKPPASAEDVSNITQLSNFMGMPTATPEVNVHFYVDGEEIYGKNTTKTTNGVY